ncbi:MAG TPA: YceI family protein [Burkholderiales bacterium]|nr:YceI family protein [Burkholderiales bacterium]
MKKLAIAMIAVTLPATVAAAPETYTIDPRHTFPHFTVQHLEVSNIYGRFNKSSGRLILDKAARTASIEITIETATVDTGDSERGERKRSRDEHLRSPDFFNAAEFPQMIFKGAATKWNGDIPAEVEGQLTLLGVTRPLKFTVDLFKCGPDPRVGGRREVCGGNGTGVLKRSDFGMKFGIPGTSDEIRLLLQFEAIKE